MASCDFSVPSNPCANELTVTELLDGTPVRSGVVDLRPLVTFGYYSVGKDSGSTQTIPHNVWGWRSFGGTGIMIGLFNVLL